MGYIYIKSSRAESNESKESRREEEEEEETRLLYDERG